MKPLQIDPGFKALIPPLTAEQKAQLESNLLHDGCLHPLIVWNNTLIDGHNRYEICERHKIHYDTLNMSFASREDVELWMIDYHIGQRNLEAIDRVPLIERKRAILEKQARERMESGVSSDNPPLNLAEGKGEVREQLAAEIGVSKMTYQALKTVSEEGTPELKQAVREKRVGASTAAKIASMTQDEQAEILEKPTRGEIVEAVKERLKNNLPQESKPPEEMPIIGKRRASMDLAIGNEMAMAAIITLDRILKIDKERTEALTRVRNYCDTRLNSNK